MTVSDADTGGAWGLFRDSPIFAKWPDGLALISSLLEVMPLRPDRVVYRPGNVPTHLYLVGGGSVQQTVARAGRVWLQQELAPGQFFGQEALFSGAYQALATAAPGSLIYRMSVADARVALEKNQDLREEFLHEKRAGRLRRIPLLRGLNDMEVRALAQVIAERELLARQSLPLRDEPGLWIVDRGQVKLRGAINPHPLAWSEWAITAGEFFIAVGPDAPLEAGRVADSARTSLKTTLFHLPAADFARLGSAFPEIRAVMARSPDASELLRPVPLFEGIDDRQRQHLAQFCGSEFVPAGQNMTTQGSIGHSFVILREGAAVVTALDDHGRPRPLHFLKPGGFYGTTSLRLGKPRDATVRAVRSSSAGGEPGLDGADIVVLDRRDLEYAFAENRRLWRTGAALTSQLVMKVEQQPYDWMDEGEERRWDGRGHLLWLAAPEGGVLLAALLLVGIVLSLPANLRAAAAVGILIAGGIGLTMLGIWFAINYFDDYYVVTNRRVTRRDRQLLMYEARVEAPLEMVQDVTIDTDFWGRLFNYGNVTIRTASKIGNIIFQRVPTPEWVKNRVLEGKAEALASGRGQQRELLRRGLIADLKLALPIPERTRPLGEGVRRPGRFGRLQRTKSHVAISTALLPGTRGRTPDWLKRATRRLPEKWQKILIGPPKPEPKPLSGQVMWHKHWLNLVQRAGWAFLAVLSLLVVVAILRKLGMSPLGLSPTGVSLAWLFLMVLAVGWFLWGYVDYRNDMYAVTDEKIIDVEMKPLGLYAQRREGSLDRVQNVVAEQRGIWANFFNYGDVVIKTAAADEGFTFLFVPNPRLVQAVIFQKMDALRREQEDQKGRDRQRELIEGLEVYHELQGEKPSSGPPAP